MNSITHQLSQYVSSLKYADLPEQVVSRTKLLVLDTAGIALRARHEADSTPVMIAAIHRLGFGKGNTSVIGDEASYVAPAAAFINGALAHSLDFDDTHAPASIHSSAPIVPAALAAAEMCGAHGKELIAGIIAGYEVQIRLSLALVPKDHYDRGFHPTATCGTFGAAAAAGRILGLSAQQQVSAFGLCSSQAAGTMQFLVDGAWNKPFQVGYAAMNGLISACFAGEGYRGTKQAIEGRAGFLRSYAPDPIPEKAVEGLGEHYETMGLAVKPYPACRYSHAALDALIELRETHQLQTDEIERVEIGLPRTGWNIIGNPVEDKQRPQNVVDGQFSMPFCAAVVLKQGSLGWDDYARYLGDPEILALCQRVWPMVDPQAEAEFPKNLSGVVRVHTKRGDVERFVCVPKGEPDNFLTLEELRAKFDGLVGHHLSIEKRDQLAEALLQLDQTEDISVLLGLSRPGASAAKQTLSAVD